MKQVTNTRTQTEDTTDKLGDKKKKDKLETLAKGNKRERRDKKEELTGRKK